MSKLTEEQKSMFKDRLTEFLNIYGHLYSPEEKYTIEYRFLGRSFEEDYSIDLMDEIYQELGVYEIVPNIYKDFYETLIKYHSIDQRLLEVGCGILPSFAKMLATKQKSGTLTAIDPNLRFSGYSEFATKRDWFTSSYDVSNVDLIYGIKPCAATLDIIKVANENDKDLCVLACKCAHFPYEYVMDRKDVTYDDWEAYVEEVLRISLPETRELIKEESVNFGYQIFITKKLSNR